MSSWSRRLLAIAAVSVGVASAHPLPVVPAPDHEVAIKQVQARKADAYREALAGFDAAMQATPGDAAIGVERCRFINQFTDEDYGDYIESAPADFEACTQALETRWPREPVVQLFSLEQLWGADAVARGEKLLETAGSWPTPLRRELLTQLANAQDNEDNEARAGELALEAVRLGDTTLVADAVNHLVAGAKFAEAQELLRRTPLDEGAWRAKARVESALALPDRRAALVELQRFARANIEVDTAVAARAHLRAGDVAGARKLLEKDAEDSGGLKQVRFDAALAAGDFRGATAYIGIGAKDDLPQSLERFATLARRAPGTLFTAPMLLGVFVCLFMLATVALLPGLLLLPAHYRGLARRLHGKPAIPLFPAIGLWRAWYGAAVLICVPAVVGMAVDPAAMAAMLDGKVPEGAAFFRAMLSGTIAGVLCILPGVRGLGFRQLVGDRDALRGAWRIPAAWACLLAIGVTLHWWHAHGGANTETMQTKTVHALATGGVEAYGAAITLLLIAVLTPVFEEIAFRGLLLGGLTRHISFGWANVFQAALFALVHDDPPRFLYYFALGLFGGLLVRRFKALGPAIGLHMLNNAMAFWL